MFAISEAIVVKVAYPSCGCCSIEYFASRLDLVLEFGLEYVRFAETEYSVVAVKAAFESFRKMKDLPG